MMLAALDLPRHESEVVTWVSQLLRQAQHYQASDLHIDPRADGAMLRLRIHGIMQDWHSIPSAWLARLASRLKVLAGMDLGERRLPQDGRLNLGDGGCVRLATLPTLHGEKLCLRFAAQGEVRALDALDCPSDVLAQLREALQSPHGLILITGPTGSGKTTTLYACLDALNRNDRHIATVEDPIEQSLVGVNQTAIAPRIGLDFATVLRAMLRHDPDVLMIGEIRDRETADIAVQAAETGHLVLSTLHTGSALDTLTRLRHLGIADYLICANLRLVLSQRLLRRECPRCHGQNNSGCPQCHGGYVGRMGIYESLQLNEQLAQAWLTGASSEALRPLLQQQGWLSLYERAQQALRGGHTGVAEIQRVLGLSA